MCYAIWRLATAVYQLARVCSVAIFLADLCLVNSAGLQPEFTDGMLSNIPPLGGDSVYVAPVANLPIGEA
jgi:hypothetical protein